ncbi:MAG: amidohydrolase family protein, partial [Candidatus Korobacteraceae bacterium]
MRPVSFLFALCLFATLLVTTNAVADDATKSPDVIFINGDIYTQATPRRAQAIAVRDGRIVAVGSTGEISKLKGTHTQVVDLGGHFVMPGFNDAHCHLASGGFQKMNVDLEGARSLLEMQHRIGLRANKAAASEWILGQGWDHTLWPNQTLPTRQDID